MIEYLPMTIFRFSDSGQFYEANVFGKICATKEEAIEKLLDITSLSIESYSGPAPVFMVNGLLTPHYPVFAYTLNGWKDDDLVSFLSGRMIADSDRISRDGPPRFDFFNSKIVEIDCELVSEWAKKVLLDKIKIIVEPHFVIQTAHGVGGVYLIETLYRLLNKDEAKATELFFKIISKRLQLPDYNGDLDDFVVSLKSVIPHLFEVLPQA